MLYSNKEIWSMDPEDEHDSKICLENLYKPLKGPMSTQLMFKFIMKLGMMAYKKHVHFVGQI